MPGDVVQLAPKRLHRLRRRIGQDRRCQLDPNSIGRLEKVVQVDGNTRRPVAGRPNLGQPILNGLAQMPMVKVHRIVSPFIRIGSAH